MPLEIFQTKDSKGRYSQSLVDFTVMRMTVGGQDAT